MNIQISKLDDYISKMKFSETSSEVSKDNSKVPFDIFSNEEICNKISDLLLEKYNGLNKEKFLEKVNNGKVQDLIDKYGYSNLIKFYKDRIQFSRKDLNQYYKEEKKSFDFITEEEDNFALNRKRISGNNIYLFADVSEEDLLAVNILNGEKKIVSINDKELIISDYKKLQDKFKVSLEVLKNISGYIKIDDLLDIYPESNYRNIVSDNTTPHDEGIDLLNAKEVFTRKNQEIITEYYVKKFTDTNFIDLGCGTCSKSALELAINSKARRYIGIDQMRYCSSENIDGLSVNYLGGNFLEFLEVFKKGLQLENNTYILSGLELVSDNNREKLIKFLNTNLKRGDFIILNDDEYNVYIGLLDCKHKIDKLQDIGGYNKVNIYKILDFDININNIDELISNYGVNYLIEVYKRSYYFSEENLLEYFKIKNELFNLKKGIDNGKTKKDIFKIEKREKILYQEYKKSLNIFNLLSKYLEQEQILEISPPNIVIKNCDSNFAALFLKLENYLEQEELEKFLNNENLLKNFTVFFSKGYELKENLVNFFCENTFNYIDIFGNNLYFQRLLKIYENNLIIDNIEFDSDLDIILKDENKFNNFIELSLNKDYLDYLGLRVILDKYENVSYIKNLFELVKKGYLDVDHLNYRPYTYIDFGDERKFNILKKIYESDFSFLVNDYKDITIYDVFKIRDDRIYIFLDELIKNKNDIIITKKKVNEKLVIEIYNEYI